jgi:hypothetical protein
MNTERNKRPFGIAALSVFFLLGSLISFTAGFFASFTKWFP